MKFRLVLAALVGAACFLSSCGGDDDGPVNPPAETPPPSRGTADSLLTSWFERAYEEEDEDLYDEMLDSAFTFVFLPADRDSFALELGLDQNGAWGKMSDVTTTENMFDDGTVSDILLELSVSPAFPYPGGDCTDCLQIEANVNLHVVTNPPGADEPLELIVDGPQTFILRPVPSASDTLWVIFRQLDRPPAGKRAGGGDERGISSTEARSWGQVKAQFF